MKTRFLLVLAVLIILPLMAISSLLGNSAVAQSDTGTTALVSVDSAGVQGDDDSFSSVISANGRFVAFASKADNLVSGDSNGQIDVFVHDQETGQTTRVSIASDGVQGDDISYNPAISADGRFIAFDSEASNLVSGDTNETTDVFVHDRNTGQTTRVSVASDGVQGDQLSDLPAISADGRFVAFPSHATNLVSGDTNETIDVFVHDQETGQTTRVSVASDGVQGNGHSGIAAISSDGRFVAFESTSGNFDIGETFGPLSIFVHDRETGQTTRVSVASDGALANDMSYSPSISADGRFVAFTSGASNLVSGDTNERSDGFVHDRETGQTTRISVDSVGIQGNHNSGFAAISADGRFVAFTSGASNLVSGDTNEVGDIFVHDRQTGQTTRVSVTSNGVQIDYDSFSFLNSISADGRFVVFESNADNLVSNDTNFSTDVFVHEVEGSVVPTATPTPLPTPSPTVSPTPTPIPTPSPTPSSTVIDYFALGDSIASGHGLMDSGPCRQSTRAYPYKVAQELEKRYDIVDFGFLHFLACSGDSSVDLATQVNFVISTLKSIPSDQPVLVSITIGANDFQWHEPTNLIRRLYLQSDTNYRFWVDTTAARVQVNLLKQLNRLLAYPNVAIVVTELYNPFNEDSVIFLSPRGNTCLLVDCYTRINYAVDTLNFFLNAADSGSNEHERVQVTSTLRTNFIGHESPQPYCGKASPAVGSTWIQYPTDRNSNSNPDFPNWVWSIIEFILGVQLSEEDKKTGDCLHPNEEGATQYAAAVNQAAIALGR